MASIFFSLRTKFLVLILALIPLTLPLPVVADIARLSCMLTVVTSEGETHIREKDKRDVFVARGEVVQITWTSKNAKTALSHEGKRDAFSGVETFAPRESTVYSYNFSSGNRKALCQVSVHVVTASIDAVETFASAKPTITGTASGAKVVRVLIREQGDRKVVYKSKLLKVRNEKWKARLSKKLSDGVYEVEVVVGTKSAARTMTHGTFTIGSHKKSDDRVARATFVVAAVPLLTGGTTSANAVIPISYLQIINGGPESASLRGFWVKQTGSAAPEVVMSLSVVDDQGVPRGDVGGVAGRTPFVNGSAFVPAIAVFAPGEMRLFTIKSTLSHDISSARGKQLMLDVTSVDATATVRGVFPIRGTTWFIQ